jgi:predicted AlkP superfamily phosphohydrolase/phosphomutase
MRFLRMLTNSLLAGGLGAAYLTVLVLQLNPDIPLLSGTVWRWFLVLAVTYGLVLAAGFYALIVVRNFFSIETLSPGWASVRVLAWLSAAAAGLAATLMWLNASGFRVVLGEVAVRRMMAGALATSAAAVVLLAIAIVHYSYGRRGSRVGGALFTLAALGSMVLPLAARGPAVPRTPELAPLVLETLPAVQQPGAPRVAMLLLDGASLEYIRARSADGRLPNFSRLLEAGASMYLAVFRPAHPAPVWAAAATGMYPSKSGVRSGAAYHAPGDRRAVGLLPDYCFAHALVRLGLVRDAPHTSEAWRARPLWDILARYGLSSGVVRWPLTYPAPPARGFILSDRFHEPEGPLPQVAFPPGLLSNGDMAEAETLPAVAAREQPETDASQRDRHYSRALRVLAAEHATRLAALRLEAVDAAGHRHVSAIEPIAFRDDDDDDARRTGAQQLDHAYAEADHEVGLALDALGPGDLLLVVSGFGMQRLHPVKELLARTLGDPASRGTHERAPDGFLMAYGTPVHPGRLPRGSIVDVTPTVLYFLGLPIGRDMDGFVRTDLFTSDFTAERPIAFISSHK